MQTLAHTATGITVHVHHTLESSLTHFKPGEMKNKVSRMLLLGVGQFEIKISDVFIILLMSG